MIKSPEQIRDALRDRLFGRKIIQNNFRGELVERIIETAIGPTWVHCSDDWASWDFRRDRQLVQVKQAAARQTWDRDGEIMPKRVPAFAIRPNSGYYIGPKWKTLEKPRRLAQIYIFAWHDDPTAAADHFDPARWTFFVVPAEILDGLDGLGGDRPKGSITIPQLQLMVGRGRVKNVPLDELLATMEDVSGASSKSDLPLDLIEFPAGLKRFSN